MKKYFFSIVLISLMGCKDLLETDQEKKRKENDEELARYVAASGLNMQKSPTGLYYSITPGAGNRKPLAKEQVAVHFVLSRLNGVKVDSSSVLFGKPDFFPYGVGYKLPGIEEGLSMMKEGDKATFLIPSYLGFWSQDFDVLPAYSNIRYDVTFISTRNEEEQIEEYIAKNKLTVTEKTTTGLRFVRTQANPTGAAITNGQLVSLNYKGSLLRDIRTLSQSGTAFVYNPVFDAGQFSFNLNVGSVIPGFNEAVGKMRVGEKAIAIMPSSLGYAEKTTGNIPPFSPLVFEIEIVSAK